MTGQPAHRIGLKPSPCLYFSSLILNIFLFEQNHPDQLSKGQAFINNRQTLEKLGLMYDKDKNMNKLITASFFFITFFFLIFPADSLLHAQDRFVDNEDGTVTDTLLRVMWTKTDNQGDITWKQAQQWITYTLPYTLPNYYDNWRLPSIDELKTLYNHNALDKGYEADCGQKVKIVSVIELSCGWVWASEKKLISAWLFNFQRGYAYTDRISKKRAYRILGVRNLEE